MIKISSKINTNNSQEKIDSINQVASRAISQYIRENENAKNIIVSIKINNSNEANVTISGD